jgi:hypothetical protein
VTITYPKAAHTSGDKANGLAKYVSERKVANRLRYSSGESFHKIIFMDGDASSFILVSFVEQLNCCVGDRVGPSLLSRSPLLTWSPSHGLIGAKTALRMLLASCFVPTPSPSIVGDTVDIIVVVVGEEDDNSNAARQLANVTSTHDASSLADLTVASTSVAVLVVGVFMVMTFMC